jgi:hypothetical protein
MVSGIPTARAWRRQLQYRAAESEARETILSRGEDLYTVARTPLAIDIVDHDANMEIIA